MLALTTADPILGGFVVCRPEPMTHCNGTVHGFTLLSDLHIGAAHVDYSIIRRELATAGERGDRILVNGDVFDLILTGDKKRFTGDVLHPRLQGRQDLVNAAVEMAVELLSPYAPQIDMIGLGNHETAVSKYHSVDVLSILIHELQKTIPRRTKHTIHYGGYTGFIDYRSRWAGPQQTKERHGIANSQRLVIYYHHGAGGSAPVTKGMIDFNRRDTFIDADVLWLGHKHNRWNAHALKLSCPIIGSGPKVKDVRHIMTGAYFQTYAGQSQSSIRRHGRRSNYAADAGMAPQGMGGARLELHFGNINKPYQMRVIQ